MNSLADFESLLHRASCQCELNEYMKILRNVDAFSVVPIDKLKVMAYLSQKVTFPQGTFLFKQRDPDARGYILVSGRVQLYRHYKDKSYLLEELKEGEFFGGLALLSDIRRLFSARAAVDTVCLTLERDAFRRFIVQFPEVAIKVLDIMIRRIVAMEERLLEMQVLECRYV
ncbi:Crp/Fnr family transcriptional regulator [Thermodesulforhabdus norvegica]|uniref:Cyclic nucleotide-binding domain-containing protein n=1 Tax=Thermodesulforhabdus norvegica TaxID=39841 RepID=A0A1I4VYM1_9BACT|nr:Crp/Fnr family transcriptional regulator [Thermodesulforhabdus norvegica]SFN06418.1 Cyclic nucleotide-binding domain-containing protein [Thermodesulforhabdus norvegica]